MSLTMTLLPRMSEKAYSQSKNRTYVFDVPMSANKHSVARAVSKQFEVTVEAVNLLKVKGKAKRTIAQKGRKAIDGRDASYKKAYVTVVEGQHVPIFDAMEEAEAKSEEQQQKMDKAMEKQAKKAAKESK